MPSHRFTQWAAAAIRALPINETLHAYPFYAHPCHAYPVQVTDSV